MSPENRTTEAITLFSVQLSASFDALLRLPHNLALAVSHKVVFIRTSYFVQLVIQSIITRAREPTYHPARAKPKAKAKPKPKPKPKPIVPNDTAKRLQFPSCWQRGSDRSNWLWIDILSTGYNRVEPCLILGWCLLINKRPPVF